MPPACRGGPVRGQGIGRPQVPDRRQGRAQPHPCRAAARRSMRVTASARPRSPRWLDDFDARCLARMGTRARRGHLRRQFRARVPAGPQGRAAAARLGAPPARCERAVPRAPPLAGLEWRRRAAFRHARRRPWTSSPDATVLALGGGSWPELGSDGAWVDTLVANAASTSLRCKPSNCGFDIGWSAALRPAPCRRPAEAGGGALARCRR